MQDQELWLLPLAHRTHKSYIIALDKINTIERQEITIKDRIIPIGITYQEPFFKFLETRKP